MIETAPFPEQSTALLLAIELHTTAPSEIRVAFLKRVHEQHSHDFWANARLGAWLIYAGKYEEAIGYYRAALAIRPGVSMVHSNLGVALCQANRPGEAIVHYRKAVALDPAGIVIRQNLIAALWNSYASQIIRAHG